MIDLWDFGTDGTRDGTQDGSVPVVAAQSDATCDVFTVGSSRSDGPAIIRTKVRFPTLGAYPQREASLTVNMKTGAYATRRQPPAVPDRVLDLLAGTSLARPGSWRRT